MEETHEQRKARIIAEIEKRMASPRKRCMGCGGPAEMQASLGPACADCYDALDG